MLYQLYIQHAVENVSVLYILHINHILHHDIIYILHIHFILSVIKQQTLVMVVGGGT